MKVGRYRALALVLLLAGCEEEDAAPDDPAPDAASRQDAADDLTDFGEDEAGALDSQPGHDTGAPAALDGASQLDTATDLDAAAQTDADLTRDAGPGDEAGMDAGQAADSGSSDAAPLDAGDAAPDVESADAMADASPDAGPTCDDGNAATEDFAHPQLGCGVRTHVNWVRFGLSGNGYLELDLLHGRLWSPALLIANNPNVTYAQIQTHCDGLSLRGVSDFRLPSIDDVRTLAGGCAETALGGSCPLSAAEPACTAAQCGLSDSCESCIGGPLSTGPNRGYYCRVEVPDCLGVWTDTSCSDCAAGHRWFYGVINGNFYHQDASTQAGRCVASAP
ncbi:MAG TPA: hypothetical protein VFZ61_00860 [Polyangiales bacterium]